MKYLTFVIALLIVLLGNFILAAQTSVTIKGKIIDQQTNVPLELATISLKGKSIGTVSNSDGEFELTVSNNYVNDTVAFSMLGYAGYQNKVSQLLPNNFLTIKLTFTPVILKELVVKADAVSPNEIFRKAYENIKLTFLQEPYALKSFYRQLNTENDKAVLLIEAAVDIYDRKYSLNKSFNLEEKIIVNQVRASSSHFKNTNKNYFEESNTLTGLLLFNFTKYNNKYVMERTNFTLDSMEYLNDKLVYVISSVSSGSQLTNRFTFHIDAERFAFLKIKNESIAHEGKFLQNFDVPGSPDQSKVLKLIASSQTYQFKEYKKRMYLEQATSFSKGQIINSSTNDVEWTVTDENSLVVYEVLTGNLKTPKENNMDKGKNLKHLNKKYNPDFWTNADLIKLTPLTRKQRNELESTESLQKQFAKEGNIK